MDPESPAFAEQFTADAQRNTHFLSLDTAGRHNVLQAQDPQRVLMDENESDATTYYRDDYVNPEYSFIIDNSSLEIEFEQIN